MMFQFHFPLCTHIEIVEKVLNHITNIVLKINADSDEELQKEYMKYQIFRFFGEHQKDYNDP